MTAETSTSTRPPQSGPPPRLRASDAEREETANRLHQALGEGRLNLAETEERVAAAYAAQYRDELPPLLADLPQPSATTSWNWSAAPTWAEVWTAAVWRARTTLLGAGAGDRPTAAQARTAAVLSALAALWTVVCAFLGAGLVH
jgi:Domain of unknown function (DUF1707)